MASYVKKRLELIGDKLQNEIRVCQGLVVKFRQGIDLSAAERVDVGKLKTSTTRLKDELQNYVVQQQGPHSDEMERVIEQLTTDQMAAEDLIVELNMEGLGKGSPHATNHTIQTTSRLPQLELPQFSGNVLEWHEYWSQFAASIDGRTDLSDVDKLTYLQRTLTGKAKERIAGLTTSNENYKIAVDTLNDEYGEDGILTDAHYMALFSIPKADPQENKKVLADIDRHLRILNAMGENTGQNNALRAIIVSKFSLEVQRNLRMKLTPTQATVHQIMDALKIIIKALDTEAIDLFKSSDHDKTPSQSFTTEALFSQNEKPQFQTNKKRKQKFQGSNEQKRTKFEPKKLQRQHPHDNSAKTTFNPKLGSSSHGPSTSSGRTRDAKTLHMGKKDRMLCCVFCHGGHIHENCRRFKTLEERKAQLRGRCFRCLKESHHAVDCPDKSISCVHCGKKAHHNRCLCPKICPAEVTVTYFSHLRGDTILQTAETLIPAAGSGKMVKAKLLFDSGSQRTYIHSALAKKLKLKALEQTCLTIFTFGAAKPKMINADLVSITIMTKGRSVDVLAYVVHYTTGKLPSNNDIRAQLHQRLPTLDWAPDSKTDINAELIIGNDYYYKFVLPERREIADGLYVVRTAFGWIPSGSFKVNDTTNYQLSILTYVDQGCICANEDIFIRPDSAITRNDNIKLLWELEAIGIADPPKVVQDEVIIDYFNKTTIFSDNRYYVKWPWVEFPPHLPSNWGLALGRLKSLLKRLDPNQRQLYNDVLVDQLDKGMIEIVENTKTKATHPIHYLPHHCVISENKSTKLRIVYDASAKIKGKCSLNELLYKGPLMLEDLCSLLLKFRDKRIGVVADVEKAFLQVGLQMEDRDVTRFLWVKDVDATPSDDNLICLRFCRVPFGVISSPFLLAATIRHHLQGKDSKYTRQLANCLYVDNLVTAVDNQAQARDLQSTAKSSLEELSMNLRGWNSNDKAFLNSLPPSLRDTEQVISVLGLKWNTVTDSLQLAFTPAKLDRAVHTKRQVLKIIASVFDPCGFVSPLTLPTRIFLQTLWKKGLNWDTPLSSEQHKEWDVCARYLQQIPRFLTTRCYVPSGRPYELHCFADSSQDAYVAVTYVRAPLASTCDVGFVMSKSRVAPIQRKDTLTIPKMELLAVLIGVRLIDYVRRALDLCSTNTFLWTDSQVVLGWLHTERLLPPWVSRRVGEIHRTPNIQFRYVPTALNPADVATRPLGQDDIPAVWMAGPEFLHLTTDQWPSHHQYTIFEKCGPTDENLKPTDCANPCNSISLSNTAEALPELELPANGISLPVSTVLAVQRRYFTEEISRKTTNLTRSLNTYIDQDGLIRCKGRYQHAALPFEQRNPILLPKESEVTSWVIKRVHNENYHVGVSHTLSLVRQRYWVPQGRQVVSRVLKRCPECVKYGGGPFQLPNMPDLPHERINYSSPFTYTGLDYLGPLMVSEQGVSKKRWICLFTCMAVRAIHLEVVDNLSAEEFIRCLRRFVAMRGPPKLILSDNATQFKLAAAILKSPIIQQNDIEWRFITELSPWKGGLYERLVALVKHCLHRTLGNSMLNDSQLRTVMREIESTLNTRPLTTVGPDNEQVLTPQHFLRTCGPPNLPPPEGDSFRLPTDIQQRVVDGWKQTNTLLRGFQDMFVNQYLLGLRERHLPRIKQPRILSPRTPCEGDIVQIKGDTNNRALWKVGKITSLRRSADGEIRSAQVTLNNDTIMQRSIGHLYPLEMHVTQTVEPTKSDPPDTHVPPDHNTDPPQPPGRPRRTAAKQARQRIRLWTSTLFSLAASSSATY